MNKNEDYFNIAEVMTVGAGNTAKVDVKGNDLFVVETNGRSRRHVRAQKQFNGEQYINPVNHSVTVQVDLYKVMCGIESLAEYAMKIALSIENEMALDILYALQNSYNSLSANFKEASYTPTAFKTLATRVTAANGGAKAVAIGTELALQDILPTDQYLKMGLGETYNSVGYLPVFLNTPLIGLAQKIDWASEDYDFAVDDTQVYFISPSAGKLVQVAIEDEGLYIEDGAFDNANLTINATFHKSWAVALATGAKYAIMKVQ